LPAHIGQQAGTKLLLQILHNRKPTADVDGTVTARASLRVPAISELPLFRGRFHLTKKLAALHLLHSRTLVFDIQAKRSAFSENRGYGFSWRVPALLETDPALAIRMG
jgi:hypothetical protein